MKRRNLLALLIAALPTILNLSSCSSEISEARLPEAGITRTVRFEADANNTKTAFGTPDGSSVPTLWTANDAAVKISVNLGEGTDAAVERSSDGKSARFTANLNDDGSADYTFYALSPATAAGGFSASGISVKIPEIQNAITGSCDEAAQVLFAKSDHFSSFPESAALNFRHLTAYGKISLSGIPADAALSQLILISEADLAGSWKYDPDGGTLTPVTTSGTIKINTSSVSDIWFACAPADLGGKELTVVALTDKGKFGKTATLPAGRKFEAGKIASINIGLEAIEETDLAVWTLEKENMVAINGSQWSTTKGAIENTNDHYIYADTEYPGAFIRFNNNGASASSYEIWKGDDDPTWYYRIWKSRGKNTMDIEVPVRDLAAGTKVRIRMGMYGTKYVVKNWLVEFHDGVKWQAAPKIYQSGTASVKLEEKVLFNIDHTFELASAVSGEGKLQFRITNVGTGTIDGSTNANSAYLRLLGADYETRIRVFIPDSYEDVRTLSGPVEPADYDVLGLGTFPVSDWWVPYWSMTSKERYQEMKDCGINVVDYCGEVGKQPADIIQALDWCEELGLKLFPEYGGTRSQIQSYAGDNDDSRLDGLIDVFSQYANHPAYIGEHFMDEPHTDHFPGLQKLSAKYEAAFPGKLPFVNLYPTYASTDRLGAGDYEEYLDRWLATEGLRWASFDNYPLKSDGSILTDYFYNLDIFRAKTRAKRIPFWCFVQTTGHGSKKTPNENELRWLVATCYAFGSKGIQYFCYFTPSEAHGDYEPALIDRSGNKTVTYDYARRLNSDFEAFKVLMNCHAEGVIQHTDRAYRTFQYIDRYGPLNEVQGGNVNVGCFVSTTGEYKFFVLNQLPSQGTTNAALSFDSRIGKVRLTTAGGTSVQNLSGGLLNLTLEDGQPVLVEILAD